MSEPKESKAPRKAHVVKLKKEGKGDKAFYLPCGRLFLGEKSGTLMWNDRHEEYAVFPEDEKKDDESEPKESASSRRPYVVKLKKEGKGDKAFYLPCGRLFLGEKSGTLMWNDRHEEYAVFPEDEKKDD